MSYWYDEEMDREAKAEAKRYSKKGELSANAWRFNDRGSRDPMCARMDNILAAYADAQATDSCWC